MPDQSLRLVFAGTPDFAARHLKGLIQPGLVPVAVFTQPDRPVGRGKKILPTPVKALAQEHQIPVFQPERLEGDTGDLLASLDADLMIVVAYGIILKPDILEMPRFGCINVHASLLPRWRGAAPIERAILAGDSETGVSIMQMDAGLDTGNVLLELKTPILDDDNAATLTDRLIDLGIDGLVEVLRDLGTYQSTSIPQDPALACYAAKLSKEDAHIDWQLDAEAIQHQVQAFFPRSPAWCWFRSERLRILKARKIKDSSGKSPGTILNSDHGQLVVACGHDSLIVEVLQLPGKTAATVKDILNGHPTLFNPGDSLANPAP